MSDDGDDLPYDFLAEPAITLPVNELGDDAVYHFWVAMQRLIGPNPDLRRRIMMIENDPRGDAVLVYRTILIFFERLNRHVFSVSRVERPARNGDGETGPGAAAE